MADKITLTPENIAVLETMGWRYLQYSTNEFQWMKVGADVENTGKGVPIEGDETWAADLLDAGVLPAGADFVVPQGPARAALVAYWEAMTAAEIEAGQKMIDAGMKPEHAMSAMVDSLIKRAAALACGTAIAYLDREPDPARWRTVTDGIFVVAADAAKRIFADHDARARDDAGELVP